LWQQNKSTGQNLYKIKNDENKSQQNKCSSPRKCTYAKHIRKKTNQGQTQDQITLDFSIFMIVTNGGKKINKTKENQ